MGIHAVLEDGPELDGDESGRGVGGGVEAVFEGAMDQRCKHRINEGGIWIHGQFIEHINAK